MGHCIKVFEASHSNNTILKNLICSLLVILAIGIGNSMAQYLTEIPIIYTKTELISCTETSFPLLNWQGNWSIQSIAQIETLIRKHGIPDKITQSKMLWKLPGDVPKTITFTEYFLYLPDTISKNIISCDTIKYDRH